MAERSPVFRCATYGLRVAAFMIQVPCSPTKALVDSHSNGPGILAQVPGCCCQIDTALWGVHSQHAARSALGERNSSTLLQDAILGAIAAFALPNLEAPQPAHSSFTWAVAWILVSLP